MRRYRKPSNHLMKTMTGLLIAGLFLSGCAQIPSLESIREDGMKVVLTTGFHEDEVFRIEEVSCSRSEAMVYMINMQNAYQHSLGPEIWEQEADGVRMGERLRESALSRLAQVKTMNLLAARKGITLDDQELQQAEKAAQEYYESLNTAEIAAMDNCSEETIRTMYREYALADKYYQYTIRDINPEVSDDEARTVTLQQIVLRTYTLDADGERLEYSENRKQEVYRRAVEILQQLEEGESFQALATKYNEAEESTISVDKKYSDQAVVSAAFNLSTDEVSDVCRVDDGYVILKCITTFDREETQANKVKIIEQKRSEAFGEEYDAYVRTLARQRNDALWETLVLPEDSAITTDDFFEIYEKTFSTR